MVALTVAVLVRCALLCGVCLRLCCVFVLKCSVRVCLEVDVCERAYLQVNVQHQKSSDEFFSMYNTKNQVMNFFCVQNVAILARKRIMKQFAQRWRK